MAALSLTQAAKEFEREMVKLMQGAPEQANSLAALVRRIRAGFMACEPTGWESVDLRIHSMLRTFATRKFLPADSPHSEVS